MYDRKAIRRRRAVLAVFVALSIAILTAYFGESGGGVFHTLQRGAQESFAPIETGASRALKPVRDFFGWAGDTVDAKDQNEELKKEVQKLRGELAEAQTAVRDSGQLKGIAELHELDYFPQGTEPVTAVVRPEVGNPEELLLENVESGRRVTEGTLVNTSGFSSGRLESLFPRGIPIGRVTKVDFDELETYQRVHVKPFADLRQLDIVQVLTRRGVAQETAVLPGAGG